MESKEFVRKVSALVALLAIAAAVLIVTPASMRLVAALMALPLETLILTSIVGGSSRRVPQP
jgi:uncharacterized integral membrane protein